MASSAPPQSHSKALPHVKSSSAGSMPDVPPRPSADHASPQVSLIFLAEFDINEGSVLKHQYPSPAGLDEQCVQPCAPPALSSC